MIGKNEMEIIKSIKEFVEGEAFAGFKVETGEQVITLSISNFQQCCESFGYFWSPDDADAFIGANLLSVAVTDHELYKATLAEIYDEERKLEGYYYEGGVMFVDLETDRGILQFVAYNQHNGCYGHQAKVECKQLQRTMEL
jgi:hypothetical protein